MYYLEKGLHSPLLAKIFAFFGVSVAVTWNWNIYASKINFMMLLLCHLDSTVT